MTTATANDRLVAGFYEIDIARLLPHPRNIRKDLGDLAELTASIVDKGILEPLLVALEGGFVVCGHRRLAAATLAGRLRVPCVVSAIEDHEAVELMLIENMQRNGLTPVEEAQAYQQLLEFGQTPDEISENVSVNADRIRRRVALLQLPAMARDLLESHRITIGAAEELLQLKGHNDEIERLIEHSGFDSDVARHADTPLASFSWQLAEAKGRVKIIEDRAAAQTKIEQEGLKVVDIPDTYSAKKTGPKRLGTGYGELNTPVGAHRKLDCHAVALSSNGKLVSVCTKPKNHPEAIEQKSSSSSAPRHDYQAEQRAREEASGKRLTVLRQYCQDHPNGSAEVDALAVMNRNGYFEVLDSVVCDILDVGHGGDRQATAPLTKWLVEGATAISGCMPLPTTQRLATVRLAIDLASLDASFEENEENEEIATAYVLFLRGLGYEPTEEEMESFKADDVLEWAKSPAKAFA